MIVAQTGPVPPTARKRLAARAFRRALNLTPGAAGDYEQALQRLRIAVAEQALELATLAEIKANPYADPLLEAPGFRELRGRIGR